METADAIVVGAGILGVGTAYNLQKRGYGRILILERDSVCSGSTALASGGIRLQWGRRVGIDLVRRSMEIFDNFKEIFGQHLPVDRRGYLYLIRTPEELEGYRRQIAFQQSLDVEVYLLTPDEIKKKFPYLNTDDLLGGAYGPQDRQADPYLATTIMADAARELGVEIRTSCEVTGFRRSGRKLETIQTTKGEFQAPTIVLAGGAWSKPLGRLAGIDIPVIPRRRDEFITAPFPTDLIPASTPFITDFSAAFSFRRHGQGMMLGLSPVGPEASSFDTAPDWDALPRLIEKAVHRCPVLENAAIASAFGGLLESTPDHQGIADRVPDLDGVYVVCGFSGHGFQQGPSVTELMAEMITEGQATSIDISALRYTRFAEGDLQPEPMVSLAKPG